MISVDGIIYSHIKTGGYNGDQFIEYLEGLLSVMNPYPAPHSVLVIDNCRIHHVEGVEELCAARYVTNPPMVATLLIDLPVASNSYIYLPTCPISIPSKNVSLSSTTIFAGMARSSVTLLRVEIRPDPTFFYMQHWTK